jgi:hypothetical protein
METMFYLWKRFKVSEFPKKVFSKLEPVVLAMGFGILHFGEFWREIDDMDGQDGSKVVSSLLFLLRITVYPLERNIVLPLET